MVLLRIPTALQPMTGIEGLNYQSSDGRGSVIHTLFVRDFAAIAAPHLTLMYNSCTFSLVNRGRHRLVITLTLSRASLTLTLSGSSAYDDGMNIIQL